MAHAGDSMTTPETGETFVFLKTAQDTEGKLLRFYTYVEPGGGGKGAPVHIHPIQEERFYILYGEMRAQLGDEWRTYRPGDHIVIPAGTKHTWNNASETEELVFAAEFEPALEWEYLFESLAARSQRGLLNKDGSSSLLDIAVALHHYRNHLYLANMPIWVQKLLFAVLYPIGRLLGHKPYYTYDPTLPVHLQTQERITALHPKVEYSYATTESV